jgi:hypothetical protein
MKFRNLVKSWFRSYNERWFSWIRDLGIRNEPSQRRHLKSPGLKCEPMAGL